MSAPVFLAEPGTLDQLTPGAGYLLDGAEGRHAGVVQRRGPGERVDVVDGQGVRICGRVVRVTADGVLLDVDDVHREEPSRPALVLAQALATVQGVTGRMERIDEGQPFTVIVDYAHTPDSLAKVLSILRPLTSGKLMAVFGSAGERDHQKRPIMGKIAAQSTDFFVITDEDPRDEDRQQILEDIAAGARSAGKREGVDFLCIADRREAIASAFARARKGDTVLLAGKGHEQSIIMGTTKIPWDDRQVAREQLAILGNECH